jgi:hypothetical protein
MSHAELADGTQSELRLLDLGSASKQLSTAAQLDLDGLSGEISGLMLLYCDAIEACRSVQRFSILPLSILLFKFWLWLVCFEICFLVGPIDLLVIYPIRRVFGRPRFVLGRRVYACVMRPFQSAWDGEIPAIAVFRLRYLARLLLFYRAQLKINTLHRVFNRRQLDLFFSPNQNGLGECEKFQKSFDLFQRITADSYQIGAVAIGGPLVALCAYALQSGVYPLLVRAVQKVDYSVLASFIQKIVSPLVTPLVVFGFATETPSGEPIGTLVAFFIIAIIVMLWILVSAWMDMRSILLRLDIPRIERQAYRCAGIKEGRQIWFDLLFFNGLIASVLLWLVLSRKLNEDTLSSGVWLAGLLCLGMVAWARRLWLSRDTTTHLNLLISKVTGWNPWRARNVSQSAI